MSTNIMEVIKELKFLEFTVEQAEPDGWIVRSKNGEAPIGEIATSDQVINFYTIIDKLECTLTQLAMNWRGAHTTNDAAFFVSEYHQTISQLWNLGWRGTDLPPDSELPDQLMPEYFLSYWQKRS